MQLGSAHAWTALTLLALAAPAAAQEHEPARRPWLSEVRVGVLAHDVNGLWSGSREESGLDYNLELILGRPSFRFLSGSIRPNLGVSVNSRGHTSKVYAGLLWQRVTDWGGFLNLGLGLAAHDGERETTRDDRTELGSDVLFRIPIELGLTIGERHSLSLFFDHVSNAGLGDENEGLDTLGLRYGFRF